MKFVVASYGTRGDIEPCAAVGLELQRRGHDVCLAVPPNLIGFVETAGLSAVAYGSRDSQEELRARSPSCAQTSEIMASVWTGVWTGVLPKPK